MNQKITLLRVNVLKCARICRIAPPVCRFHLSQRVEVYDGIGVTGYIFLLLSAPGMFGRGKYSLHGFSERINTDVEEDFSCHRSAWSALVAERREREGMPHHPSTAHLNRLVGLHTKLSSGVNGCLHLLQIIPTA